jgi:hypothetical protein
MFKPTMAQVLKMLLMVSICTQTFLEHIVWIVVLHIMLEMHFMLENGVKELKIGSMNFKMLLN